MIGVMVSCTSYMIWLCVFLGFANVGACRPNIIFISADDLGWAEVSWNNDKVITPNLASFAARSVKLNRAYVQPVCTPSRTAFMTGTFPFKLDRQNDYLRVLTPTGVSLNATFLPQILKSQNYSTHAIGKWHLGHCKWEYTPTYRGFDTFFGFYSGNNDYYTYVREANYNGTKDSGLDLHNNTTPDFSKNGSYSSFLFAGEANRIIKNRVTNKPLFIYLSFQAPHAPLEVDQSYRQLYLNVTSNANRRKHLGMVTAMDEAFGTIIQTLEDENILDNTVVVFTSDNGGQVEYEGYSWPLRGAKNTVWEGGVRVPAFVYSSMLSSQAGTVSNANVHAVDWLATFAHLASVPSTQISAMNIDSLNIWQDLVDGTATIRTAFPINIYDESPVRGAIRNGQYKLIVRNPGTPKGWYPPPELNLPTPSIPSYGQVKLFDVIADPLEQNEISANHSDIVASMQAMFDQYVAEMVPADDPADDPAGQPMHFGGVISPGWC